MEKIPLLTDVLEPYAKTPEGLQLWKTKGVELTYKNLLENVFITSSDIADFFEIQHRNFISRNFFNLRQEGFLTDHTLKIKRMVKIGSSAQRLQTIYALTRQETEFLIMDLSGPKARTKKLEILRSLHAIESDVLQGAFDQALAKASTWDGVQLLQDLGFQGSLPNDMATKKDIAGFLGIPMGSLASFLSKHSDQIVATKLTKDQIRAAGSNANRMNAYTQDDVFKIAFWMDTEAGRKLKQKIFGDMAVYATPKSKEELGWKIVLAKVFEGLGFQYQYRIGEYVVDFFVEKLGLVLECDRDNHRYYDPKKEVARDKAITKHYAMIRFNSEIALETLINGVLKIRTKELLKLYTEIPIR